MVKKHRETILAVVSDVRMKSTREIQQETGQRVGKVINWSDLFRTLKDMESKRLIKCFETGAGFFWIKESYPLL